MAATVLSWLKNLWPGAGEAAACNWCRRIPSETRPPLRFTTAGLLFPSGNKATLCSPCQSDYLSAPDHHEIIFVSKSTPPECESLLRALRPVNSEIIEQFALATARTFTTFQITDLAPKLVEFWNEPPAVWRPHGDRDCTWKARLKTSSLRSGPTAARFAGLTLTLTSVPTSRWGTASRELLTVFRTDQHGFQVEKRLRMGRHLPEDSTGQLKDL